MGKDYELAVYSKDDFVWDKKDLLVAGGHLVLACGAGMDVINAGWSSLAVPTGGDKTNRS